jgi:Ca-activated chloride channel family protein
MMLSGFPRSVSLLLLFVGVVAAPMGHVVARSGPCPTPSQQTRPRRTTDAQRATEPQEDKPIRLSADLVTVLASVSDPAGNLVSDLTREDFEIYEDNAQQDIAGLYREEQKSLRLVFLFDTSGSIRSRFDFEKRAAALFFKHVLQPGDEAAIISVATDPTLEVGFIPDADKLVSTLEHLKPGGATALYNALLDAAKLLRRAPGRHVIVVLSDGTDTSSSATLAQGLAEVQKSDAVIYSVHSMGVAPSPNVQDLAGEFVMKAMSEDTGGRAFFPPIYTDAKKEARDLDEIYKRVAAEIRAQYVLTYYSKAGARDDRFRAIRVQVKRPGLQVRARRGYYTAKA